MYMEMFPLVSTSIDPSVLEGTDMAALPAVIVDAIIFTAIGVVIEKGVDILFEKL